MKKLCFTIALAVACAASDATADACDVPNLKGYDSVYCFAKVYIGEDDRLNEMYQTLRQKLASADRNTLRTAQRRWIEQRNTHCMTGPTTVNVECALSVTRARADFLSARIVECNSVGCASSKLTQY